MRVLLTTSTFPVRTGDGIPRFVLDLALALRSHAKVYVVAPDGPGARREEEMDGLEIRRFTYFLPRRLQRLALGDGMRDNLRRSWLAKVQVPLFLFQQARVTSKVARKGKTDVVNAHWIVPGGLAAAWARGRRGRFRLVLHVHAGDVYLLKRMPFGRMIARWVVSRADAVFAAGSHVRETLLDLVGEGHRVDLRPMGVDVGMFGCATREGERRSHLPESQRFPDGFLLFFGRFSEKKGTVYLVRALPKLLESYPGLGLVLIGDGPEKTRLMEEVTRLRLEQSVCFLGRRPHEDIVQYLHACRAAVVPSIVDSRGETEGMPTVVMEAMAAGVRVVGSAVNGIPDIIQHGINGWLCEPKNPGDLASKILLALQDEGSSEVVAQAVATASRNEWSQVAEEYAEAFRRVLGGDTR
jgi:glycosyltransferase involved in cell wall biosynthesis